MTSPPSSGTVYNNAASMHLDSRTPGMTLIVQSWAALQDFTGGWAVANYNQAINIANLSQEQWT